MIKSCNMVILVSLFLTFIMAQNNDELKTYGFINISTDHMDRYDNFDDYFNTKLKVFENSKYCFFNNDDKILRERIIKNKSNKESLSFGI